MEEDYEDYDLDVKEKAILLVKSDVIKLEKQILQKEEELQKIKKDMNAVIADIEKETIAKDNLIEDQKRLETVIQKKCDEKKIATGTWFGKKKVCKQLDDEIEECKKGSDELGKDIEKHEMELNKLKQKIQGIKMKKEVVEGRIRQLSSEKAEKSECVKEKLEEIRRLEEKENSLMAKPFRELPEELEMLDEKVKNYYLQEFQNLENLPTEYSCINILLVGPSGSGKSSFVNTCATALANKKRMVHASTTREFATSSATLKLIPEELDVSSESNVKAKIFDCRGLSPFDIGKDEISLIIGGHIKHYSEVTDVQTMKTNERVYIEKPEVKHEMHCIVYVVKATKSKHLLEDDTQKHLTALMDFLTPTCKPQFVLLTNMDSIVPGKDVKNLFRYKCVSTKCKAACDITHVTPGYILLMANYTTEAIPTDTKDSLGLLNLHRIISSGYDYITRRIKEDKVKTEHCV